MNQVISLGPIALSLERLAALTAISLFLLATEWISRRETRKAATVGWLAAAGGVVAARLGYVVGNFEAFRVEPLSALYVWQGGFALVPGVAAAAVIVALSLKARARWLSLASLAGLTAGWLALSAILDRGPSRPLPEMAGMIDVRGVAIAPPRARGPMIVNLWATWCPPCRREMPLLQETAAANPDIPMLLVNQSEAPSTVRSYLQREGIDPRRVVIDPDGGFASRLGASALPTTLFVNSQGEIVQVHSGEISRAALVSGLRDLK